MSNDTRTLVITGQFTARQKTRVNVDAAWYAQAFVALTELANDGQPFTADDVRQALVDADGPEAAHPNHWGILFNEARRAGVIRVAGAEESVRPVRKGGLLRVWTGGVVSS